MTLRLQGKRVLITQADDFMGPVTREVFVEEGAEVIADTRDLTPPEAAAAAVERAGKSLRDLRIAEVAELDMQLKDGKVEAYRAKVKVSFKYEGGD